MAVRRNVIHLSPWLLLLVTSAAWANVGIPMLILAWPAYVLGLVPVIAIESFIGTRTIGLSWGKAIEVTTIGNLWSTFIGIPVVWAGMLAVEFVVGVSFMKVEQNDILQWILFPFTVAWIATKNIWTVYLAFIILAIPFCIASIWIESKVAVRKLPDRSPDDVRRWVRRANIWSYGLLVACAIAFPITG
jgi:hypothetical protein